MSPPASAAHSTVSTASAPPRNCRLVLLGAGHAQVQVLHGLARERPAHLHITLVAPHARQMYSGMVPGFVAGHYPLEACTIALPGLVKACGAQWRQTSAVGLDAGRRELALADGQTLAYDLLSINTGAVMERQAMAAQLPGAADHALFVRPIEEFARLWPHLTRLSPGGPLHLVVLGGGAAGVELAMAAHHALNHQEGRPPGSRVTLLAGPAGVGANYPPGVRRRVLAALERRAITVIPESGAGFEPGHAVLASGTRLACDAGIVAIGGQAPAWLQGSGLALDDAGFIQTNAFLQSTSHAEVFAAGDIASRADAPRPRSGVYAVRAGPPLLANLRASANGQPLRPYQPQRRTLNLLSCGGKTAIASWGDWSASGAWVWWWKDRIDRAFIARYNTAA